MRIKAVPDDFIVEELVSDLALAREGPFGVFRLEKRGISTLDVLSELARIWRLPGAAFAVLGLKDARAVSVQYLSARGRFLPKDFKGRRYRLRLLGRSERALGRDLARGNRFRIVLRDLSEADAGRLARAWPRLLERGFPNYFGPQRFGSAGPLGWLGRHVLLGDAEAALRSWLGAPARGDAPAAKAFRKRVGARWGDWKACLDGAPPSPERSVLTYLAAHPRDFAGALDRAPERLLEVFLSAYQALLWNRLASAWLEANAACDLRRPAGLERLAFPRAGLPAGAAERTIDLPGRKASYAGALGPVAEAVFAAEGLTGVSWRPRLLSRAEFHRGERAVGVFPAQEAAPEAGADELHAGRRRLSLAFRLPPGAYATVLLDSLDSCYNP